MGQHHTPPSIRGGRAFVLCSMSRRVVFHSLNQWPARRSKRRRSTNRPVIRASQAVPPQVPSDRSLLEHAHIKPWTTAQCRLNCIVDTQLRGRSHRRRMLKPLRPGLRGGEDDLLTADSSCELMPGTDHKAKPNTLHRSAQPVSGCIHCRCRRHWLR